MGTKRARGKASETHGKSCHVIQDDGYFSFKGFRSDAREQTEACDPRWERPIEVDIDVGDRRIDADVHSRRLMGSSLPEGVYEHGLTLEERELWELNLDMCMEENGASLSELTTHRGPSARDRRAGFVESANSRKFMQKPDPTVENAAEAILKGIAEGEAPSIDQLRELAMLTAVDLCQSKNPASRAKGLQAIEKFVGGIKADEPEVNADEDLGI